MTHDDLKKRAELAMRGTCDTTAHDAIRDLLAALEKSEAQTRAAAFEEAARHALNCTKYEGPASQEAGLCRQLAKDFRALASMPPGVVVLTREEVEALAKQQCGLCRRGEPLTGGRHTVMADIPVSVTCEGNKIRAILERKR